MALPALKRLKLQELLTSLSPESAMYFSIVSAVAKLEYVKKDSILLGDTESREMNSL